MHITDTQIVEFGLGKLGIFQTHLQSLAEEGDDYFGIAIERYAEEIGKLGDTIPDEHNYTKVADDIVLVFHTSKAVYSFIDDLNILANNLTEKENANN